MASSSFPRTSATFPSLLTVIWHFLQASPRPPPLLPLDVVRAERSGPLCQRGATPVAAAAAAGLGPLATTTFPSSKVRGREGVEEATAKRRRQHDDVAAGATGARRRRRPGVDVKQRLDGYTEKKQGCWILPHGRSRNNASMRGVIDCQKPRGPLETRATLGASILSPPRSPLARSTGESRA